MNLFTEEIINSVPEVASHFEKHNDAQIWNSGRFKNTKYVAVACMGDQYDFTYEEVGWTNSWKEARRLHNMGADIYCNNERIYFVDHEAVQEAFDDLQFDEIVGLDMVTEYALEADGRRKSAQNILKQNGLAADAAWRKKVQERYDYAMLMHWLNEPFYSRHLTTYNPKTNKYESGKIETKDLPF